MGESHSSTKRLRVGLYARVSTLNNQHPELQLAEMREYAARRDWTVSGEFLDEGISGSRESRPALNRLMDQARRRQIDSIVVWKLDRFGRSLKHLVNALAELEAIGVAFVSLRDNLDLSTPAGRLMFHVIAAMSEFERGLIRERVAAGIRSARTRGARIGRPRVAVNISQVSVLRQSGASWRAISRQLGVSVGAAHRAYALRSENPDVTAAISR